MFRSASKSRHGWARYLQSGEGKGRSCWEGMFVRRLNTTSTISVRTTWLVPLVHNLKQSSGMQLCQAQWQISQRLCRAINNLRSIISANSQHQIPETEYCSGLTKVATHAISNFSESTVDAIGHHLPNTLKLIIVSRKGRRILWVRLVTIQNAEFVFKGLGFGVTSIHSV
jgi:hypothetical protein